MKTSFLIIAVIFYTFTSFAKDKVTLNGGQTIKGQIILLEDHKVVIAKGKKEYQFSPNHVEYIEFDIQNLKIAKIILENSEDFTYLNGQADAQLYHKRFGGNFALGVLFGVFGFVGVAVGNVKDPPPGIPEYSEKINSFEYREGYKKKGKGKNLGAAGIGWAVSFVILLLII